MPTQASILLSISCRPPHFIAETSPGNRKAISVRASRGKIVVRYKTGFRWSGASFGMAVYFGRTVPRIRASRGRRSQASGFYFMSY
jgi:hypothetical protein